MPLYRSFGFTFKSTNLLLPELIELPNLEDLADVVISEEHYEDLSFTSANSYHSRSLQIVDKGIQISANGVGVFKIISGCQILWSRLHQDIEDSDIHSYILGSPFGALLVQRGILVLHGNALVKENRAIVCLGKSGSGKSTLAYSLMKEGWNLIADDLVAISSDDMVLPGIPRIKLWANAASALGLDIESLIPIKNNSRKYILYNDQVVSSVSPTTISAFYLINYSPENRQYEYTKNSLLNTTSIGSISKIHSQKEALYTIREHLYRPQIVRSLGKEGLSFIAIAQLLQSIDVYKLTLPFGIPVMQQWLKEVHF